MVKSGDPFSVPTLLGVVLCLKPPRLRKTLDFCSVTQLDSVWCFKGSLGMILKLLVRPVQGLLLSPCSSWLPDWAQNLFPGWPEIAIYSLQAPGLFLSTVLQRVSISLSLVGTHCFCCCRVEDCGLHDLVGWDSNMYRFLLFLRLKCHYIALVSLEHTM